VDRALVTGESEALRITSGADVKAGTLNPTGAIDIRASRAAKDSFLAEVTQMISSAENGRTGYVRVADRMAKIYAPAVHVLAFASFVGWMLWTKGDWHQSLTVAIAVLIITCPCALGLAVPVALVVSAGRLFKAGILMKDGSALERLAAITDAVFDKTGTLTTGEPAVRATTIPSGPPAALAKALALRTSHPAARALARYLPELPLGYVVDVHEVAGQGVEARYHDKRVRLGRPEWVAEISSQERSEANTPGSAFAFEGRPLYLSCFTETLRPDAAWMVSALRGQAATRYKVLMVGDGLNDAPALVAAHVSMAPSSASDVGRTAADFVFTRSSLSAVVYAYDMAVATHRIVKQNFGLAIIYNLLAVPLAVSGQLNPLMAAIAMSTSSLIVVGNSLRLHLLKPRMPEAPTVKKSNRRSSTVVERYT
jgi:P-type Cu2+ transporter